MWSEVILRPQGRGFTAELFCLKDARLFHGSPPASSCLSCPQKSRHTKKRPLTLQKRGVRRTLSYISGKDTAAQQSLSVVCGTEKGIQELEWIELNFLF